MCGDSKRKKQKSRGYVYAQGNELFFKCHNCGVSAYFGTFLKQIDPALYQQYVYEKFAETGGGKGVPHANPTDLFKSEEPVFRQKDDGSSFTESILITLDRLPDDNEAVEYCRMRELTTYFQLKRLQYIEHTKNITQWFPQYTTLEKNEEPRLVIPYYDIHDKNKLIGVGMRALRGESMRYINVRDETNSPLIFGYHDIDFTRPVLVVEGALDSLFLPNAIAVSGTSFGKLDELPIAKDNLTIIFDNEPRNVDVCRLMDKYIKKGYKIVIWPSGIKGKDINQMVLNGTSIEKIHQTILDHTYTGLMASIKFAEWRKCDI